jgi:vesicular inhibitory amino acid transporter
LRPVIRLVLAVLVTVGALVMPSFESSMAILGGGFGVIMIIVLPVWAAGEALGWKRWYGAVIAASLVLAAAGTGAAIITARDTRDL